MAADSEISRLLESPHDRPSSTGPGNEGDHDTLSSDAEHLVTAISILPFSFLAGLGMACTAASSIFAYATLLCEDPRHCRNMEQTRYIGSIAIAVTIANIFSLLALGPLEKISRSRRKLSIALWICCRAMSVVMLALGVYCGSIAVALVGKIFQGLASDNLLHFNLNAIYVRLNRKSQISRFIGVSLALFMIGISISPAAAGLLKNFFLSFFAALGIFGLSLIYLLVIVGNKHPGNSFLDAAKDNTHNHLEEHASIKQDHRNTLFGMSRVLFSPLLLFISRPSSLTSGFSILIYNTVQSYMLTMMMVHTSLELGFTSKQNGNLLSIIHAVSACYLFLVLVGIPRIMERRKRADFSASRDRTSTLNAVLALLSFVTQIITLSCFGNASQPWQVYIISAISALGLATPSFIKSHFLGYFPKEKSGKAMAALSMMEALGALISPLILGAWQTLNPGNRVFYGAAGMIAMAGILFGCSALILAKRDLILSASEGI